MSFSVSLSEVKTALHQKRQLPVVRESTEDFPPYCYTMPESHSVHGRSSLMVQYKEGLEGFKKTSRDAFAVWGKCTTGATGKSGQYGFETSLARKAKSASSLRARVVPTQTETHSRVQGGVAREDLIHFRVHESQKSQLFLDQVFVVCCVPIYVVHI